MSTSTGTSTVDLWSSLVVRGPLENTVLPAFTVSSGIAVTAVFDPTTVLMERLTAGDRPAVIVSTTGSLEALPPGFVANGSLAPLVRSGIGIGIAENATVPQIATTDELVTALLKARSVAYSRAGQSGIYFRTLLARLNILDEVLETATALETGFTGHAVLDGRADLAIQQVSELRFVPGIQVIGALPGEVQQYTDFSVAILADHANSPTVRELYAYLTGDQARQVYLAEGLLIAPAAV